MTEGRLKEIEQHCRMVRPLSVIDTQELIDEVRFLQAALADARKELEGNPQPDLQVGFGPGGSGHVTSPR